jgi:hypothetical protein
MKDCSSISATASPSWCRHDGVPTARDQGELCCPWRCSGGDYRWVIYMLASEVVWLLCSMWMYLSCPAHLNQCEDSSKIQPSLRLLLWIRRSWRSYFLVRWYNDTMNRIQLFVFFFRLTQSCSYSMISYLFSSTLNTTSSVESCSQWNARIFYPSITLSLIALQFEGHWAHSRFGKWCQIFDASFVSVSWCPSHLLWLFHICYDVGWRRLRLSMVKYQCAKSIGRRYTNGHTHPLSLGIVS